MSGKEYTPRVLHAHRAAEGDKPTVRCGCGKLTWHTNSLMLCPDCWDDANRFEKKGGKYI